LIGEERRERSSLVCSKTKKEEGGKEIRRNFWRFQ